MRISEILTLSRLACDVNVRSKKGVLEALAKLLTNDVANLSADAIFDSLIARERLGSTGLGGGIAIPHGRISGVDRAYGAFMRTREGVAFDAIDNKPVDLFFALVVPAESTDEHLGILAQLAEMFSDGSFVTRLRASLTPHDIYRLLTTWERRQ